MIEKDSKNLKDFLPTNDGSFCKDFDISNIFEGFGHKSKKIVNFLYISSGSLSELKMQVKISKRLGYISNSSITVKIDEIKKMLFGLIKSLKK